MGGHFPLEGDGCVVSLFHYIWSKNQFKKSCPLVNVPDTIVYKYRQPAYWYFTSRDPAGGVKMKNKQNLGNVRVEESLCNKPASSSNEVVAYYISSESTTQGTVTTMQHFDKDGLRDFLNHHKKENNGILQRFVDSKGAHNTIFRAIWSPNVFHVERRANVHEVADRKQTLHQRVVTFEGDEHFSAALTVTDTLFGSQVQRICESIADHCSLHLHAQGTASHVSRMVLHFKVDENNRVWLLWCSSVRLSPDEIRLNELRDTTPIDIHSLLTVPDKIKRLLGPKSGASADVKNPDFVCGPCQFIHGNLFSHEVVQGRMCEITYKLVMDYFENHKSDMTADPASVSWMPALDDIPDDEIVPETEGGEIDMAGLLGLGAGESRGEPIPPVFLKLHPNLTRQNYALLRKDPLFLYSRMAVCDQCFLLMTAAHAPRLPVVDRMPSALLMERSTCGISDSIAASMGVPVHENQSMLRQSSISSRNDHSVSPTRGRGGDGADSALSGKETKMGNHNSYNHGYPAEAAAGGRDKSGGGGRSLSSLGHSPAVRGAGGKAHAPRSHSVMSMGKGGGGGGGVSGRAHREVDL